ncbi:hypothetical protein MZO42_06095 [Sphingomonas psychrotolerans]|uniref:Uncharacterized protein n=1 Tax=Sphingomonas psychrotolerans TaxID=1327635 RepID=A0ABU3N129_9SPHN|nr:hypothetical protein [Sphingomonas psychrotolerans]MDT8758263.1 hypothetical protein [Sphingomonas psychrotolerans]
MNMMTTRDLISPAQLEHADTLLGFWIGQADRRFVRLDEAVAAVADLDRQEQALHGRASPRVIATLLKLRGFRETTVERTDGEDAPAFIKNSSAPRSQTEERIRGLAFAREWRERNKPIFDGMFGRAGGGNA